MNDSISGPPKAPTPSGPFPTAPLPEEHPPLTTKVVSIDHLESFDSMDYQGADTLGATGMTLLQFAPKTFYEASIQFPELPLPDPEGQTGPQPYGSAEQKLIKHNLSKKLIEELKKTGLPIEAQKELYEAILSGNPVKDPKQAKLAKSISDEVSGTIREGGRLPSSWTIVSTSPLDWIAVPVKPYDPEKQKEIESSYDSTFDKTLKSYAEKSTPQLTSEQMEMIVSAHATGKVSSSIADHFEAVSKIATEEVQIKFGLPNTWFKGTANLEDLKPVNLGIVTPAAVNQARAEFILGNVEKMMNDISASVQKVLDRLPPDDPAKLIGKDYILAISEAIQQLKAILREMQIKDAERSKKIEVERAGLSKTRDIALEADIKKQEEIQEKQEKSARFSFIMKIIGPVIAALATIVGALLAIFTFGASTALIVAGIAVGIALTAYSIADSITGCTGKIVQAVNEALKNRHPDNEPLQKFLKFLIMAAVVVVLVIAVVLTGGGAGASIGAQTAAQVARQAIMEAIKQLSLQVIVMTIMSSNAIPELLGAILKKCGVDKQTCQIWEIVMMAITMMVAMIAVVKGGGVKAPGAVEKASAASLGAIATIKQIGSQIMTATKELMDRMKEGVEEIIKMLMKLINDLVNKLVGFVKEIPGAIKGAFDELASAAKALLKAINEGRGVEFIGEALARFAASLKEFSISTKTAAAAAFEKVLEEAFAILKKAGGKIAENARELADGFAEIGKGLKKIPEIFILLKEYRELKGLLVKTAEQLERFEKLSKFINEKGLETMGIQASTSVTKTLQLTSATLETASGITQGVMGIQVYHLLLEVGDIKMAEELLQAMIDQLNKLLQSLSSGMDSNMEALKGVNQFLTNFWASQSETSSKIARSLQG